MRLNKSMFEWREMFREIALSIVMVFSAAALVYEWLSMYNRFDPFLVFLAALLMASLAMLLISVEMRMREITEEFQNIKRTIAITSDELESRISKTISPEIRELGERIDALQKKLFR
jgi:ABC-type multidrug transport system fused ATPase/permease subunit